MAYLDDIDTAYPVRCSNEQKEAFRAYALREAAASGYEAAPRADEGHVNVVIGDVERAKVIFTAHYDTPRRSLLPNLMLPLNNPLSYAYGIGKALPLAVISICAALWAREGLRGALSEPVARVAMVAIYMALYFGLFCLLFNGPANRRNRNDNTSGVAVVMELCAKLRGNPDAAFILFDDEEKGKKGSGALAKALPDLRQRAFVVNMDCVGNGEVFIACVPEAAEKDPLYAPLADALSRCGRQAILSRKASMNSDHKRFEKGVGLCACKYKKPFGYYTARLHTVRDTEASVENVSVLADALGGFVEALRP